MTFEDFKLKEITGEKFYGILYTTEGIDMRRVAGAIYHQSNYVDFHFTRISKKPLRGNITSKTLFTVEITENEKGDFTCDGIRTEELKERRAVVLHFSGKEGDADAEYELRFECDCLNGAWYETVEYGSRYDIGVYIRQSCLEKA